MKNQVTALSEQQCDDFCNAWEGALHNILHQLETTDKEIDDDLVSDLLSNYYDDLDGVYIKVDYTNIDEVIKLMSIAFRHFRDNSRIGVEMTNELITIREKIRKEHNAFLSLLEATYEVCANLNIK